MKRGVKKPVKARRRWVINPKTRVVEDGTVYNRRKTKEETKRLYERNQNQA